MVSRSFFRVHSLFHLLTLGAVRGAGMERQRRAVLKELTGPRAGNPLTEHSH